MDRKLKLTLRTGAQAMDSQPIPLLSNNWHPRVDQQEPTQLPIPPPDGIGSLPGHGTPASEYSLTYRRSDLTRICRRLRPREYYFGESLLSDETIENLDQTQIRGAIQALTAKVDELAQRVRLPASDQNHPEFILRSPPHLYQLLYLVDFSEMQANSQAFLQNKQLLARVISVFKQQVVGTTHVFRLADELHVIYSKKASRHIRLTSGLIEKLEAEIDSVESLNGLLEQAVTQSSSLFKERLLLLSTIRRCIKFKIIELSRFFRSNLLLHFQSFLDEEPPFEQEEEWLRRVIEGFEAMKPHLRIVECIQEFLSPYLEGRISLATEDRDRPEIRQWLIPIIRYEFPTFEVRDEEIETIALSTYLVIGARGLNLRRYITMLAECAQIEGVDLTLLQQCKKGEQHTMLKDYPMTQQTIEVELIVMGAYRLYSKALQHSLRIDFRSLNLRDSEVALLAENQYMNPENPLESEWRTELGMQALSRYSP